MELEHIVYLYLVYKYGYLTGDIRKNMLGHKCNKNMLLNLMWRIQQCCEDRNE